MLHKRTDPKWVNHKGEKVPREYVDNYDKKKEAVVSKLFRKAIKLNKDLKDFKKLAFSEVDDLYNLMLKNENIEPGDRKGNFLVYSFDKTVKIAIDVSERIEFDEKINLAQIKINEFLEEKIQGADADLAIIVNNAFKTTRGRLDSKRIMSLFTYKIENPKWAEAMDLIKRSISTNCSVRYMTFALKKSDEDKHKIINLNFSNL